MDGRDLADALRKFRGGDAEVAPPRFSRSPAVYVVTALAFAVLITALAFILAGCAWLGLVGKTGDKPGLAEATDFVWREAYGRTDAPPRVRLVEGTELVCKEASGTPGFLCLGRCRGGCTVTPLEVSVAYWGQPWADSSLTHELRHAAQGRWGVADPLHKLPDWIGDVGGDLSSCPTPPGACGIVRRALDELGVRGL